MLKCTLAIFCFYLAFAAAAGPSAAAETAAVAGTHAGVWETAARGETVEEHLPSDQAFTPWAHDPSIFDEDQGDRTEKRQVVEKVVKTIKLDNLVPPILFPLGEADIPANYLELLRGVLDSMRDRQNVRLHFIGHTDSLPLRGDLIAAVRGQHRPFPRAGGHGRRIFPAGPGASPGSHLL